MSKNLQLFCFLLIGLTFHMTYAQQSPQEISHYVFPEFENGTVLMKNGTKNEVSINYNTISEEMLFEKRGIKLAFGKAESQLVDTIFVANRKFVTINEKFVELLTDADYTLFAEYRCKLNRGGRPSGYGSTSQTTAITSYSSLAGDNTLYQLKLPSNYEIEPYIEYWIKKDGQLNQFDSKQNLKNFYKEKKDLYKTYNKDHKVDYNNTTHIIDLVNYMETH